ncbi:hypothetical protein, conserved [Leishmania tarentolae]|uniref:Cyclic nucleotide-binding domain-containing protein n=1 Tax=Leishmania tarentolae TaxID=5689 RepID=A0A640KJC5_LEITA|nr:hypothetical protein, conserved [Leishmania tarentolae]
MSTTTTPSEAKFATDDTLQCAPSARSNEMVRKMSRHGSALPLCMSRNQQEARRQSSSILSASRRRHRRSSCLLFNCNTASSTGMTVANGWGTLIGCTEANTEVGRAIQMCSVYPSMRVNGTAFENSLNLAHRQSIHVANGSFSFPSPRQVGGADVTGGIVSVLQDDGLRQRTMSISVVPESSVTLREALEESRSVLDLSQGSIRAGSIGGAGGYGSARNSLVAAGDIAARTLTFTGGSSMVPLACAMKRAAMWEILVVTVLTHRMMEVRFRRQRLRRVLERHLLPTLMKRKRSTGSVVPKDTRLRRSARACSGDATNRGALLDDAAAVPQGTYLRDHSAFFNSLHSATLLQSFAETMTRERFLPGDIIVRAGDGSQKSMYFLISGKCEVCTERGPQDGNDPAPAGEATDVNDTARYQQKISGSAASRPIKEVIMAGTTFGGVFGGSAFFAGTYRALSQCIVWVLRAEDFESIFRSFADRAMLDKYKETLRQHSLWWLKQRYNPAKCYGSIPIYRKLTKRMSSYLDDFTPVVKVRGETIFSQGDVAGDVYCMLEGTVLRQTKGVSGTYGEDGVAQRLSTNSFTALNVVGRYLMLGEEPHLVPGVQSYTCTIISRVALFFKVSGERFVNALLDDPLFYAQLRGQLMRQRQENMALHPECLAYVPLLQRFPAEKREELVQHARPRVIGRSVSLCDPAQNISDLLIIVSGSVRDPRHYSRKATKPLEVPATCEVENPDGTPGQHSGANSHVKGSRVDRRHGTLAPKSGQGADLDTFPASSSSTEDANAVPRHWSQIKAFDGNALRRSGPNPLNNVSTDMGEAVEEDALEWNFSFRDALLSSAISASMTSSSNIPNLKGSGTFSTSSAPVMSAQQQYLAMLESAPLVYPDESEDINPPLPVQPARRFVSTLGGSWEALLLDKWPNGWESMTTVEMWTISTRMLRLMYNSCPKPVQLSILNGLRHAQKQDLQLPTLPHTKLPPMSIYTYHGEAATAAAATAAKGGGAPRAKGSSRRGGDRKVAAPSTSVWATGGSGEETGVIEVVTRHSSTTRSTDRTKSTTRTVVVTAAKEANGEGSSRVPVSARQTTSGATPLLSKKIVHTSRTVADAIQEASSHEDEPQASTSARRIQDGRRRSLRRLREAATTQSASKVTPPEPTVDSNLLACYDGVVGAADPLMLRIVRDPVAVAPSKRGTRSAMPSSASMQSAQQSPLIASEVASAAAWPTLPVMQDRWFHAVPSYEPLPGTAHAAQTLASPPVFAPNSAALASACISSVSQHRKMLEGYVTYYATTASPACSVGKTSVDGASLTGEGVVGPAPAATLTCSPSQGELGTSHMHLPKLRAYTV